MEDFNSQVRSETKWEKIMSQQEKELIRWMKDLLKCVARSISAPRHLPGKAGTKRKLEFQIDHVTGSEKGFWRNPIG